MADWIGSARSNFFKVKDKEKFEEFCELFSVEPIHNEEHILDDRCIRCLNDGEGDIACEHFVRRQIGECTGKKHKEELVGFLGEKCHGQIIGYAEDDQGNQLDFDDALEMLAECLADEWVAIVQEVGAEKLLYITGFATAVNSKGEVRNINIGSIYKEAEDIGKHITYCEY